MTIPPRLPTISQILEIAETFGMTLSEQDAASFRGLMVGSIASYARLDELAEPKLAVKYPRTPRLSPCGRRKPLQRLVLEDEYHRRKQRSVGRRARRSER